MASSEVEPASKIGPSMGHVGVGASQSHMNVPISQGSSRAHLLMVLAHHKHKVISMCISLEAGSSRARQLMVLAPHKVISYHKYVSISQGRLLSDLSPYGVGVGASQGHMYVPMSQSQAQGSRLLSGSSP